MLYHALSINVNRAHLNIGCDLWWNLWVAVEGGRVEWTFRNAHFLGHVLRVSTDMMLYYT